MPHVAMQFIEFDDLGGLSLDLSDFLPKRFDPLIDRHMTKPQNSTNGSKAQAFQVQGQRQAARWSRVAVSDLWATVKKY